MKRIFGMVAPLVTVGVVLFGSPGYAQTARAPVARSATAVIAGSGSYLGVNLADINSDRAKALKLKEEYGVEVTMVEDDSPAAKAGLKVGDVVLEYNGERVEGYEQFARLVRETPVGREVKLLVSRNGSNQTLVAKIGSRPGMLLRQGNNTMVIPSIKTPQIIIPDVPRALLSWSTPMLGIVGESLEGQLADYFGVKEGVLVRSVNKDSAAEKAGIKAGDVIVKVDDTKVTTPSGVSSAIRSLRAKKSFPVTLIRDRKESTVTVTLDTDGALYQFLRPVSGIRM